jgi:phospholipid/cholesterol/gamma-HCH transport system substrate-binding protein
MQNAWKVGVLVVVFGTLFLGAYAILNRSIFAKKTVTYYAEFADAGGVNSGARVLLAGVNVGTVRSVRLAGPRQARLTLAIAEGVEIPAGSTVVLPSSLIGIGDRALNIVAPATGGAPLPAGATLPGRIQSALAGFAPEGEQTIAELNATLRATRALLEDSTLKGRLASLLESGQVTVAEFGKLAKRIDALVVANRASLSQAVAQASKVMDNLEAASREAVALVKDSSFKQRIEALLADMQSAVGEGSRLIKDMNALVNDPNLRQPLETILSNTEAMSASGARIAEQAETLVQNGITFSERAIELTEKVNNLVEDARDLVDKFKGTLGKIPSAAAGIGPIDAEFTVFRDIDPANNRAEVSVKVPFKGTNYYLGLFDAFDRNQLSLQVGKTVSPSLEARYGVYASQPGVGVDFGIGPRLRLRGDLFGLNKPRFDARAGFDLGGGLTGYVGLTRVFDRNTPTVGLGIKR